jgi:hypothetical protein
MKHVLKKYPLFPIILPLFLMIQGCVDSSSDTTGDTTQREIDRQNAAADQIYRQYSQMKGQFVGTYNFSNVLLTLDVPRETSTGNGDLSLVGIPHIIGNLTLSPQISVEDVAGPLDIPSSVTDGQYESGNDLSLTVQESGAPTVLHCQVTDLNHLNCDWYMNASTAPRASFTLDRIPSGQALVSGSAKGKEGSYVGSNRHYAKIVANFRTFLKPQSGSGSQAVPLVSVIGSFTFYPEPTDAQKQSGVDPGVEILDFMDSQYDPISNTLAITVSYMGNTVPVDCSIKSKTALQCNWLGSSGTDSREKFDLEMVADDKKSP